MVADETLTHSQIEALSEKLNAVEFTDEERAFLAAIARVAASTPDVEGFDGAWASTKKSAAQIMDGANALSNLLVLGVAEVQLRSGKNPDAPQPQ